MICHTDGKTGDISIPAADVFVTVITALNPDYPCHCETSPSPNDSTNGNLSFSAADVLKQVAL